MSPRISAALKELHAAIEEAERERLGRGEKPEPLDELARAKAKRVLRQRGAMRGGQR